MITLPVFYCPIPPAASPYGLAAEQAVLRWLDKFELSAGPEQHAYFARSRFPLFPASSLPDAEATLLSLPGKEVMWLQSFDDVYCDERPGGTDIDELVELLAKLTRLIENPQARLLTDNPWARALVDLRLSITDHATPVQLDRWIEATTAYFDGLVWETVQRTRQSPQEPDDYVAMWLKQSGVHPCTVFTDIVSGYEVPAAEWALPEVRTLRDMTAALIGWDNDLTSYDKEVRRATERDLPAVQNLVAVLAEKSSVEDAVATVSALRNRVMARFLNLRDEVAESGSPELGRYVHGLGRWVRGYLDYSSRSPRYTDSVTEKDGEVVRRATGWSITDTLPTDSIALPDLPSLAGWWN